MSVFSPGRDHVFDIKFPRLEIMLSLRAATRRELRWRRAFTVLALESSADDTCAAIVDSYRNILSNVVVKQHDL